MASEDEFDSISLPDLDEDQWDKLQIRGSRLPPPSSVPGGNASLERATEEVGQDGGGKQPMIGTQSTFSDGYSSFTESQQAWLDQILASSQPPVQAPSQPSHPFGGSPDSDIEEIADKLHIRKSLIELFRPAGTLSVTDLVHPIWWVISRPVVRYLAHCASCAIGVS
jgi:hypothetical protein